MKQQKPTEWWKPTSQHMWRTYFAIVRDTTDWDNLSEPSKKIYAICHHLFRTRFAKTDQDILRTYFTSRWGDDLYAVEDYSARTGIPTTVIWMVVRRANRIVMETLGLLERKEDNSNE